MLLAFFSAVLEWLKLHPWVIGAMIGLSAITLLATLVLVPWAIVRIPPDYFSHRRPPQPRWAQMHPAWRIAALAVKNLLGAVLLAAGVVMLFIPGPGVVAILAGLALLDLPGKRRLERWIVGRPNVFRMLNQLRAKRHQPPLEKPDWN